MSFQRNSEATHIAVSAPGKLFLGGEYAILFGGPALITAVDRRVNARLTTETAPSSMVEQSIAGTLAYFATRGLPAPEEPMVIVKSHGLYDGQNKLGLGSSAAVCAATVGLLFECANHPISQNLDTVFEVARDAHFTAQGNKGSGGDVAASVLGGYLAYKPGEMVERCEAPPVTFVPVWSGKSASTSLLIDRIMLLKEHAPELFEERIQSLISTAESLCAAYKNQQIQEIIGLSRGYGSEMAALGDSAGAPIVTEEHRQLAGLADSLGGACKPSGAGGGDMAIAIFDNPEIAATFKDRVKDLGLHAPPLALGAEGVRRD